MSLSLLRATLLAATQAEAARIEAEATDEAAARVARAEQEAAALVERARAEGAEAGAVVAAHERAEVRRRARALRLAAERDVWDELCRQSYAAAHALPDRREYEQLLARTVAAARKQLGGKPHFDHAAGGGVRATRNGRSVDYSLDALVDRVLRRLGGDVESLWR